MKQLLYTNYWSDADRQFFIEWAFDELTPVQPLMIECAEHSAAISLAYHMSKLCNGDNFRWIDSIDIYGTWVKITAAPVGVLPFATNINIHHSTNPKDGD